MIFHNFRISGWRKASAAMTLRKQQNHKLYVEGWYHHTIPTPQLIDRGYGLRKGGEILGTRYVYFSLLTVCVCVDSFRYICLHPGGVDKVASVRRTAESSLGQQGCVHVYGRGWIRVWRPMDVTTWCSLEQHTCEATCTDVKRRPARY